MNETENKNNNQNKSFNKIVIVLVLIVMFCYITLKSNINELVSIHSMFHEIRFGTGQYGNNFIRISAEIVFRVLDDSDKRMLWRHAIKLDRGNRPHIVDFVNIFSTAVFRDSSCGI